jgi:hypothetical protein
MKHPIKKDFGLNRSDRRALSGATSYYNEVIQQRQQMLNASLMASLTVLRDDFSFTPEQLNEFAEKHNKVLLKSIEGVK